MGIYYQSYTKTRPHEMNDIKKQTTGIYTKIANNRDIAKTFYTTGENDKKLRDIGFIINTYERDYIQLSEQKFGGMSIDPGHYFMFHFIMSRDNESFSNGSVYMFHSMDEMIKGIDDKIKKINDRYGVASKILKSIKL